MGEKQNRRQLKEEDKIPVMFEMRENPEKFSTMTPSDIQKWLLKDKGLYTGVSTIKKWSGYGVPMDLSEKSRRSKNTKVIELEAKLIKRFQRLEKEVKDLSYSYVGHTVAVKDKDVMVLDNLYKIADRVKALESRMVDMEKRHSLDCVGTRGDLHLLASIIKDMWTSSTHGPFPPVLGALIAKYARSDENDSQAVSN